MWPNTSETFINSVVGEILQRKPENKEVGINSVFARTTSGAQVGRASAEKKIIMKMQ